MVISGWVPRAALAVTSADAPILTLLVDQRVISALVATDIGAVIAGVAVGWQGHKVATAITTKGTT